MAPVPNNDAGNSGKVGNGDGAVAVAVLGAVVVVGKWDNVADDGDGDETVVALNG